MKCENDSCRCTIPDDAPLPFCSDHCQRQSAAELECDCGHEACARAAATGAVDEDLGDEDVDDQDLEDVEEPEDISGATGVP